MVTKTQVLDHFGSVSKAAEFFNVDVQAIYQWKEAAIPRQRELELMVRLPEVFPPDTARAADATRAAA